MSQQPNTPTLRYSDDGVARVEPSTGALQLAALICFTPDTIERGIQVLI